MIQTLSQRYDLFLTSATFIYVFTHFGVFIVCIDKAYKII